MENMQKNIKVIWWIKSLLAFAHYTWSLQNSEWRQCKYCHITDTMCRRRYDRWYDIMKD